MDSQELFDTFITAHLHKIIQQKPALPEDKNSREIVNSLMTYLSCQIYPIVLKFVDENLTI